jgi:hypothetical protein
MTIHCKIYCNSRHTNSSVAGARVVVWPEPALGLLANLKETHMVN